MKGKTIREYTHDIKTEVRSISGWYELEKEEVIRVDEEEVLYAVGNSVVDSSCCGTGGCRYALVAGYIRRLKTRQDKHGCWVSEVQPIAAGQNRQEIINLVKQKESVSQVQFW